MKKFKLVWLTFFVAIFFSCSKEEQEITVNPKSITSMFVYKGQSYTLSYKLNPSTGEPILDKNDPTAAIFLHLQENPDMATFVMDDKSVMLFDNSGDLDAFLAESKESLRKKSMKRDSYTVQALCLYIDANFIGLSETYSTSDDLSNLNNCYPYRPYPIINPPLPSFSDNISSFKCSTKIVANNNSPYCNYITFYEDINYRGKSLTYSWGSSVADFSDIKYGGKLWWTKYWHDRISSIKFK